MRWLAVAALAAFPLVCAPAISAMIAPPKIEEGLPAGYTPFSPSADTRIVYVSSSVGNDANDGLSENMPVATLGQGHSLLRDGFPDWLLLRRGDQWFESLGTWDLSGRSAAEPMLIYSYGDSPDRPALLTGTQEGFRVLNTPVSHLAIVGIRFNAHASTGFSTGGLVIFGPADDILVEDCLVERYSVNVIVMRLVGAIENVRLRRNIIIDSFSTSGHSQGLFIKASSGVLVEENLFDHNGWRESGPVATATMFNHNVYVQFDTDEDFVFRGNISSRASSHGIQARAGGLIADNLFARDPLGIQLGGGDVARPGGVHGTVVGNVVIEGNDITPDALRGNGIELSNIDPLRGATVEGNIVSSVASARNGFAITLDASDGGAGYTGVHKVNFERNIVYRWGLAMRIAGTMLGQNRVQDNVFEVADGESFLVDYFYGILPDTSAVDYSGNTYYSNKANRDELFHVIRLVGVDNVQAFYNFNEWIDVSGETGAAEGPESFFDPDRNIASYHGHLGRTPTFEAFIAGAREQSRQYYRPEYAAAPVLEYIREGFEIDPNPVSPEDLPASSSQGIAVTVGCILGAGVIGIRFALRTSPTPRR